MSGGPASPSDARVGWDGPPLAVSVAVALALRLAAMAIAFPHPERFLTIDGQQYLALARDPVGGYVDDGSPLFALGLFRTPVYPLAAAVLLRLFGGHVAGVVAGQVVLGALTAVLVGALGSLFAGPRAGRWAALFFACDPATVLYGNVFQPETLFTVLLVAAALLWMASLRDAAVGPAVAAGLLVGVATLTRPVGLAVPLALGTVALVGPEVRRRLRCLVALGLACVLVVSVWVARNARVTGTPMLTTISSMNLLYYRAAGALARAQAMTIDQARSQLDARLEATAAVTDEGRLSRARSELALRVLREHPVAAAADFADGLLRLFAGSGLTAFSALVGDPDPEALSSWWKWPILAGLLAWMVALYAAAVLGLRALLERGARREAALAGAFIVALALLSAGPQANTRFRVPLVPFLAALAGVAAGGKGSAPDGL